MYWRSLRNAPLVEEWLAGALGALSAGQAVPPEGFVARLGLLLEVLRARRGLLVLDNLETVLEPGAPTVRYRAGYAGYGEVVRRLGASAHQGCLLLTSREQSLRADDAAVRALRLEGLSVEEGRALLERQDLAGDDAAWRALVARYAGNPLALRVVGETIGVVFGGDIAAFLAQEAAVFGGIRQLLDEQVQRLSPLERAVVTWLAVEREPVGFAELVADLGPALAAGAGGRRHLHLAAGGARVCHRAPGRAGRRLARPVKGQATSPAVAWPAHASSNWWLHTSPRARVERGYLTAWDNLTARRR